MIKVNIHNVLFLDIETVPEYEDWNALSDQMKSLYELKTAYRRKDDISAEDYYKSAGIWAEFGKIICISVAYFVKKNDKEQLRVTSFSNDCEKEILIAFKGLLDKHFYQKKHLLCAHNGKEFDFPYIARRMVINQIALPKKLDLFGKKPWEIPHLDTLELWRFGDYKHYTSLNLLTSILKIPSPKDDIDGNMVRDVYYQDNNLKRIVTYCEQDTIAVAQLLLRFHNLPLINSENIINV